LFDLRYLKTKIHSLETNGEVVQLAWSPHEEAILATASNFNRRVHVWDLARIGDESDGSGPPELLVRERYIVSLYHRVVLMDLFYSLFMVAIQTILQIFAGILQFHG
jgi:WD40 repeat protein